jgi:hypothetical protein
MIDTILWHDDNIINTIFLHKTPIKKNKQHLKLIKTQTGTPLAMQCSSSKVYFYFMSHLVSTCLYFHSLAVCDWAHTSTVFVMIKFS